MRDHHALGTAGRTGRIEDIGEVVGRERQTTLTACPSPGGRGEPFGAVVQDQQVLGHGFERCGQGGIRHDQRHLGVLEHVLQAFFGVARVGGIERHIGPARLQHSQHRRQKPRRPLEADSHSRLRSHPLLLQEPRKLIGLFVQLAIGPALAAQDHRHGLGRLLRPRRDQLVQARIARIVQRRLVPPDQDSLPFILGQKRQVWTVGRSGPAMAAAKRAA